MDAQNPVFGRKLFPRKGRAGFTLLEVLVFITIVAVLVALGLPFAADLRKKAQATGCISNLRQLGAFVDLYTAENNQTYPPGYVSSATQGISVWVTYLSNSAAEIESSWSSNRRIFYCPSTTERNENEAFKRNVFTWLTDYGVNYHVFPTTLSASPSVLTVRKSSTTSNTILIFDGVGQADAKIPQNHYARHFKKANYLFADSHVEAHPQPPAEDKFWKPQ